MSKKFSLLRADRRRALSLDGGKSWLIGSREDADLHFDFCNLEQLKLRREGDKVVVEQLEETTIVTHNGATFSGEIELEDGDVLCIGEESFTFREGGNNTDLLTSLNEIPTDVRWLLKVIAGGNKGAEMALSSDVFIGSDPAKCAVVLSDISIAECHAELILGDNPKIKPLGGEVYWQGKKVIGEKDIGHGVQLELGTTTLALIDQKQLERPFSWEEKKRKRDYLWPILAGIACGIVGIAILRGRGVNLEKQIEEVLIPFSTVRSTLQGKEVSLTGHVKDRETKQQILTRLQGISNLEVRDRLSVDAVLLEDVNAYLQQQINWRTAQLTSERAGEFILRGYLADEEAIDTLQLYLQNNLPYSYRNELYTKDALRDLLEGQLQGFSISARMEMDEIVLSGHVSPSQRESFATVIEKIKSLVHSPLRMDVAYPAATTINLSDKYQVSGRSQGGGKWLVVVDGQLLGIGDQLDGMTITEIEMNKIWLARGELIFLINYSL